MSYSTWSSEPDSSAILGGIRDENLSQGEQGTLVNTEFLATYVGQKFVDLAAVLGAQPNHASSSVYRAGGRGGFPLLQIPSTSPDVSNTASVRFCQLEEDIGDLFEHADLGLGDRILGTFSVRFSGNAFYAEWNNLIGYLRDNGKYAIEVDRLTPNRSYGTLPSFSLAGTDSSAFEVCFESGSASTGTALAGNVVTFGTPGSGAQYSNWKTMVDALYPYLDSTCHYTVLVMPGEYNVSNNVWYSYEYKNLTGSTERWYQYKMWVPSYLHVTSLDKKSTRFVLDTRDQFTIHGAINVSIDSTIAGGNPSVFLTNQFSTISNITIKVNSQDPSPKITRACPSPITFVPDSSSPYVHYQGQGTNVTMGNINAVDAYEPAKLLDMFLFVADNVDFFVSGGDNLSSSVFDAWHHVSSRSGLLHTDIPASFSSSVYFNGLWTNSYFYFRNCTIKDSVVKTKYNVSNGLYSSESEISGETLACDYANLLVDGLVYEYDRVVGPTVPADSTHGWLVPGSHHFVILLSDIEWPIHKVFNNCKFLAPNMYAKSADSTVHLFNQYMFSYTMPSSASWISNEQQRQHYSDFPALVNIIGSRGSVDVGGKYFQSKRITFNNCDFRVSGKNHPQKGNDYPIAGNVSGAPFMDSTRFASEFCVGISNTGNIPVRFNSCSFSNLFDSPYCGFLLVGSNHAITPAGYTPTLYANVELNNCTAETIGYGILSLNNGNPTISLPSMISINGGRYTSYKSPLLKTTYRKWTYGLQSVSLYSPVRFYARNAKFEMIPYQFNVSSVSGGNRNSAPLWVDSTTTGGLLQFDSTDDIGVFYGCHFATPTFASFNLISLAGFDFGLDYDYLRNINGNYRFGGFLCFAQDQTSWSNERYQVFDCQFTSDWLQPVLYNKRVGPFAGWPQDTAPVIMAGCKGYDDSTFTLGRASHLLYYQSSASDNKFSQYIKLNDPRVDRF